MLRGLALAAISADGGRGAQFFFPLAADFDMPDSPPSPDREQAPPAPIESSPPRDSWRSDELLGPRDEVFILHNNDIYRLRRTRQGKLILYK